MNKHYQNAAQRLHKFAADDADCTEAELRAELTAQGVNAEAFLAGGAGVGHQTVNRDSQKAYGLGNAFAPLPAGLETK